MDPFVANHLKGVSRTYAIVIPMLPRPLDEAVGLAYLLMRIVDTLEDAPELDGATRGARLRALDSVLAAGETGIRPALAETPECRPSGRNPLRIDLAAPAGDKPAERALMAESSEVLRRLDDLTPEYASAARSCARTMIRGVLEMMERSAARGQPYPAISDAAELRQYCYYVAGVVGEMLCAMMAHHLRSPGLLRLREVAVELGVGLQLVNILKDALSDARHGRRYLPVGESGRVDSGEIYRAVLAEARASLERGVDFVLALPAAAAGLRLFCGLPIAWGAMTLARAEREAGLAKIDRGMIQRSIEQFRSLVGNDSALRAWLNDLLGRTYTRQPTRA